MNPISIIERCVKELKKYSEIKAVVLGGSYATKTSRPDSDIDIGIYYTDKNPIDMSHIKSAVNNLTNPENAIVSKIGEWGKWMNGGVWMSIDNQRVDFIYREIRFVEKTLEDCTNGIIKTDYYQQPAFGFYNFIYCAEIKGCEILCDYSNIIHKLKQKVISYPLKLKQSIINHFLWDSQFSFSRAQKSSKREEIYITGGCLTRIINDLIQVIYALNETFFFGEKKVYYDMKKFNKKPENFLAEAQNILSSIGINLASLTTSIDKTEKLIQRVISLSRNWYMPKYTKNLDDIKK